MRWYVLSLLISLLLTGCTKGTPKFSDLDPNLIPRPTFAGKTKSIKIVNQANIPILIQGECDSRISDLSIQLLGSKTWQSISTVSVSSADADCSDGLFHFSLKSIQELKDWDITQPQKFSLSVIGHTVVGDSLASELEIQYIPSQLGAVTQFRATAGSGQQLSSGGRYFTRGAVVPLEKNISSSANYSVFTGLAD